MLKKYKFNDIVVNSTTKKKPEEIDKLHYIGLEHIEPGTFKLSRWGSEIPPIGDKLIIKKGDILFGKRRAYQRKVAIAPFDGIFSAHGMVFRPKEDVICKEYLPFFISSNQFMDTALRISVGGLSPTINWKDLQKQEFNLPSIEEQQVLADKLWAAYNLKEAYKRMIAATDEMVKSQFIEMFGNIEYNPKKILKESLTSVCDFQGGSQPPKAEWSNEMKQGYIRMLQIRDFTQENRFSVEFVKDSKSLKKCNSDDILIGRYGASVGKILTGLSGAYNVAIIKSIPDVNILNKTYLKYYFESDYFQCNILNIASCRGAQQGFNKDDLSNLFILTPSIDEQKQFASIVQQADKSKFELKKAIENIDKVIKSLLQ